MNIDQGKRHAKVIVMLCPRFCDVDLSGSLAGLNELAKQTGIDRLMANEGISFTDKAIEKS